METRIIATLNDVKAGCDWLCDKEPVFGRMLEVTGIPPLRRREPGFAGLAKTVVSQQLSNASAAAIWGRLEQAASPFSPEVLLALDYDQLRQCGLSAGKIKTLNGVAQAIAGGQLTLDHWDDIDDDAACGMLTCLSGIGPWTAEVYLLSCLGRVDIWPVGDLALQKSVQDAFGLGAKPDKDDMILIAQPWRPWRAVAARVLWAYYTHALNAAKNTKE